jgi:transposase
MKLTDTQRVAINKQLTAGHSAADLAKEYGVSTSTIYNLKDAKPTKRVKRRTKKKSDHSELVMLRESNTFLIRRNDELNQLIGELYAEQRLDNY